MKQRKQDLATHLVFTYGTLKRGCRNNHLLAGSEFVTEATTKPLYKLYHNGSYPMIAPAEKGVAIKGEVWRVNQQTLSRLDRLEGVPHLYQRGFIQLDGGDLVDVIAYFYQRSLEMCKECGSEWTPALGEY